MSFRIASQFEFSRRVTARVPVDGGHEEQSFDVRFRYLPEAERERLSKEADPVRAVLSRAIVSMSDIVDDDGRELPWNDKLRDQMLDLPFVRLPLARAWGEAIAGERAKN